MTYHENHSNSNKTYTSAKESYNYTTDVDNLPHKGRFIDWTETVGFTVHHKHLGPITILGIKRNGTITYVDILYCRTGTLATVQTSHLVTGRLKDVQQPSMLNVACIGFTDNYLGPSNKAYQAWSSMLSRCYNRSNKFYKYYGGVGVKVCSRWLRYENFEEDIKFVPGYDEWLEDSNYQLDKDEFSGKFKVYSPDTCQFVTRQHNLSLINRNK